MTTNYSTTYFRAIIGFFLIVFLAGHISTISQAQSAESEELVFNLPSLNEGIEKSSEPVNLETPQAAMEHFVLHAQEEEYETAAQALNLNLIPEEQQSARAAELAERLHYVMRKQLIWDWYALPDRPDGKIDHGVTQNNPLAGESRRSFLVGSISLDGRDIAIRVNRLQVEEREPVWMISANTVENIDALYERYGPTEFDKMLPDWTKESVGNTVLLWELFVIVVLASAAIFTAGIAHKYIPKVVNKLLENADHVWLRNIGGAVSTPSAFLVGTMVFFWPIKALLSLSGPLANWLDPVFSISLIIGGTWLSARIIRYISDCLRVTYEHHLRESDSLEARKTLTYISVAKRALTLIAVLAGIGVLFAQFDSLQVFGLSMLASAGVASVVIGIAAQPVLGNIMAGMQVALSQPIRIGDNVMFEDEWGWIEEITYTFVTLRTWDKRRFVIPLTYFTSQPVENWSKNDTYTSRPIYLHVDYRMNVDVMREKFVELVKEEKGDAYEGHKVELWVTDMNDEAMEIRATCEADTPSEAWDLHVKLRERLIHWLQEYKEGVYLPRRRVRMIESQEQGR